MTNAVTLPLGHHGHVWLFAVSPHLETLDEDEVGHGLGVGTLDISHVDLIDTETMRAYGLSNYLTEAIGVAREQVTPHAADLDRLTGQLLLITSAALPQVASAIVPLDRFQLLYQFGPEFEAQPLTPLRAEAAHGILTPTTKAPMSDARIGGMVALLALLVALFLVVYVIGIS